MKHVARLVLYCIAWLLIVVNAAFGQIQWGPTYTVDTAWLTPNSYSHNPDNPPTRASDPLLVPLAPDGTDYVTVTFEEVRYAATVECTNLSPIGSLSYHLTGLYSYHLGHAPGLYAGSAENCGFPTWLVRDGWDTSNVMDMRIGDAVSGGASFWTTLWSGQTRIDDYVRIDDGGPTYPVNIFQLSMTPEWLVPSRRDPTKHAIYLTGEGDFYMGWYAHDHGGSYMTDEEFQATFSHNPWAASLTPRVSTRFTIRYGSI